MERAMRILKVVGVIMMLSVILNISIMGQLLVQGWLRPIFALGGIAMFSAAIIYQRQFARRQSK